jgi:hypothetical protein
VHDPPACPAPGLWRGRETALAHYPRRLRAFRRDLEVLREIVVVADQIEALKPMMALGAFIKGSDGQPRTNPAVVQYRLLVMLKARLMAAIRVIGDVGEDEHDRPQRRVGVKGVYTGALKAVK